MELTDLLTRADLLVRHRAAGKRQLLDALARHAAERTGIPERAIVEVLLDRERLGTTGIGRGIAIPHGKLASLERMYGVLATLETPIPFDAIDDKPVDLVFMLLAPESAGADHLQALARISRALRDRSVCDRLRRADTPDAAMAVLASGAATHAA